MVTMGGGRGGSVALPVTMGRGVVSIPSLGDIYRLSKIIQTTMIPPTIYSRFIFIIQYSNILFWFLQLQHVLLLDLPVLVDAIDDLFGQLVILDERLNLVHHRILLDGRHRLRGALLD